MIKPTWGALTCNSVRVDSMLHVHIITDSKDFQPQEIKLLRMTPFTKVDLH